MDKTGNESRNRKTWTKYVYLVSGLLAGIVIGAAVTTLPGVWGEQNKAEKTAEQEQQRQKQIEEAGYDAAKIVHLGEYKGIEVNLIPTEEDLQTEIEAFLEDHTNYEQIQGSAKEGDKVYAEIKAFVAGKEVKSAEVQDYIDLGGGMYLSKIEDSLIGMKTGKTKEINIEVPRGCYGDDAIDGKTARFQLKLDYICGETILPDYNDEFVQAVTNYHTVEEYNAYLKERLAKENQEDKKEIAWEMVVENSEIEEKDYPETLLEQQRQEILQGYYDMAKISGSTRDEVFQQFGCEDEKDFIQTELDEIAKDGAKDILISEAIALRENIMYSEEEYQAILQEEYENNRDMYQREEEYEKKNKTYLENTAQMEAVKQWIDKQAIYKE